jgi:serine/threonine-protein kinase
MQPGTRLGHYEIIGPLGAGGMGEVYEARDSKLNRNVAIKILPATLSAEPDRLARFRQEAQVLASLNHANIAAIYGIEDQGASPALVMELVPGQTLADMMTAPLPVADALAIASQIASALETAHEQGIVHRDLKPANVKVTDAGTVKVLDFGLAKALGAPGTSDADGADRGEYPTMTSPAMTEMGIILGTAGYMAPEQAKGRPVDRRADIWALGVVLFEMLTGRSLYEGETVTETIAHVITQPPSWDRLPESLPAPVRRLLRRCLEKDPRNRLQSAGDARIEIDEILSGAPGDYEPVAPVADTLAAPAAAPAWRRALPWAVAGVLLVLLGIQLWPRPTTPAQPVRVDVRLTAAEDLPVSLNNDGALVVLSPSGDTLVYLAASGSGRQLYARRLDELEGTALPGTEGAEHQFPSHDGASVAFFARGQLLRTALAGGTPTHIAPAPNARGGSWGPDDTIVFAGNIQEGLSRVSAAGGVPEPVTTLEAGERTHRWPTILPDGEHVLFICQTVDGAYDDGTIEVARIDTGERKVLIRGGTFPQYVGGYLIYSRGSTVFAARFNPDTLEIEGDPQPVLSGVLSSGGALGNSVGGTGAAQISIANNGTAAYLAGIALTQATPLRLAVVDRSGRILYEHPEQLLFRDPRISPDGEQIAVRVGPAVGGQLFLLDPRRGTLNQLTFEGQSSFAPVWSSDGRSIAFGSDQNSAHWQPFVMPIDGTGEARLLVESQQNGYPTSFSPDDQFVAVTYLKSEPSVGGTRFLPDGAGGSDIEIVSLADGTRVPFMNSPSPEADGRFSPDGEWMLFMMADQSGFGDVYVRAYPGGGALRRVSTAGGAQAVWSRAGSEIVYVDFEYRIMAVDVSVAGGALALGTPRPLLDLPLALISASGSFDATPDGSRFVVLLQPEQETAPERRTHVTMIFNFLEDLRRATEGASR